MVRFTPSRVYSLAALAGAVIAGCSVWFALRWWPAWIPAGILLAGVVGALWVAFRPGVEVNSSHLIVGRRTIDWDDIRRVDQTIWVTPMVVELTLKEGPRLRVIYPGPDDQCSLLLRLIQQRASQALINGVPHRRIFGDPPPQRPARTGPPRPPRSRFLSDDDEADVERLLQILKSAGRLDGEEQ
jgi:hypothetical protein